MNGVKATNCLDINSASKLASAVEATTAAGTAGVAAGAAAASSGTAWIHHQQVY